MVQHAAGRVLLVWLLLMATLPPGAAAQSISQAISPSVSPSVSGPTLYQPVVYQPVGAGFRVEFPGQPEVSNRAFGSVRATMASYEMQDMTFLAVTAILPAAAAIDPHAALDAARNDAIGSDGRTLVVERRLSVGGQPARRLIVDDPGRRQRVVLLLVVRGDRLYRLSVATDPRPSPPVVGEKFLNSFALIAN